jgi:hypothetical protein
MAKKTSVFSKLTEEKQEQIKSFAEFVASNPTILGEPVLVNEKTGETKERIDYNSITALIECLNEFKQIAKNVDDEMKQFDKEMKESANFKRVRSLQESLEVGDRVIFTVGNLKTRKSYEREVIKITDKCFHVEFDEDYPCSATPDKPIGIKHIKFISLLENLSKDIGNTERATA